MAEIEYQLILMMLKSKFIYIFITFTIFIIYSYSFAETNLIKNSSYLKSYLIYLKGNSFLKKLQYDKALFYYKKALKKFNGYPEPYYKLMKIYYNKHDFANIEKYIHLAEKFKMHFRNQNDLKDFYKISGEYYEKKEKYKSSIYYYNQLNSLFTNNPNIFYKIGHLYFMVKQYDKSLLFLKKFTIKVRFPNKKIKDDWKKTYMMIVNIYMIKNNYNQSMQYLKVLYKHFPEKEIKERITTLRNNLKHYNKNK